MCLAFEYLKTAPNINYYFNRQPTARSKKGYSIQHSVCILELANIAVNVPMESEP